MLAHGHFTSTIKAVYHVHWMGPGTSLLRLHPGDQAYCIVVQRESLVAISGAEPSLLRTKPVGIASLQEPQ